MISAMFARCCGAFDDAGVGDARDFCDSSGGGGEDCGDGGASRPHHRRLATKFDTKS